MGQERIDVYYKPVLDGLAIYHKYIVYTDSNGNQCAARGGPEGGLSGSSNSSGSGSGRSSANNDSNIPGYGNLKTEVGPFDEGFSDYEEDQTHEFENIITGSNLSGCWNNIVDAIWRSLDRVW